MPASYDATLPTNKDWVRLLAGDRDVVKAKLQDEEINALLIEVGNKYLAAALACELILAKTGGLVEKQVGDLKIKYGTDARSAYLGYISSLRQRGANLLMPKPRAFKVLGG